MWFIGVEAEQKTSAPPPEKKILDPPLKIWPRFEARILAVAKQWVSQKHLLVLPYTEIKHFIALKLALQVLPHGSENNTIVEIFYGANCNLKASLVEFKVKLVKLQGA